jgi:hypothetical protein
MLRPYRDPLLASGLRRVRVILTTCYTKRSLINIAPI